MKLFVFVFALQAPLFAATADVSGPLLRDVFGEGLVLKVKEEIWKSQAAKREENKKKRPPVEGLFEKSFDKKSD